MTIKFISRLSDIRHPEASLQLSWNVLQLGVIFLPLYPTVGAIFLGLALLLAWLRKFKVLIRRRLNWGFAILSGLMLISAIFSWQKSDAFLGLFNFIPFFLMFAAFSIIVQTSAQLRRIAWNLVLTSLPIGLLGFAQIFVKFQTPPICERIFGWSIIAGGNPTGRMSSVFIYANIFAGYTAIMFILALGLWLDNYRKIHFSEFKSNFKFNSDLVLLTVAVAINLTGLIFSNSRNAWLIAIIACTVYAFYQGWRMIVAVSGSLSTSILLAAYAPSPIAEFCRRFVPEFFWTRLTDQYYQDRPITLLRKTQWDFALMMTRDRPLTGWGLRNFTPLYQAVMKTWLGHPHNLFLMLAGEVGIPATLLFTSILIWIFVTSIQTVNIAKNLSSSDDLIILSYLIVFVALVLFNTFDVTLFDFRLNTLFWVLIGALTGNTYYLKTKEKFVNKSI